MKSSKEKLKRMLAESITILCKAGVADKAGFTVEGLLGITFQDEVVLISINETVSEIKEPSDRQVPDDQPAPSARTQSEGFRQSVHRSMPQEQELLDDNSPDLLITDEELPVISSVHGNYRDHGHAGTIRRSPTDDVVFLREEWDKGRTPTSTQQREIYHKQRRVSAPGDERVVLQSERRRPATNASSEIGVAYANRGRPPMSEQRKLVYQTDTRRAPSSSTETRVVYQTDTRRAPSSSTETRVVYQTDTQRAPSSSTETQVVYRAGNSRLPFSDERRVACHRGRGRYSSSVEREMYSGEASRNQDPGPMMVSCPPDRTQRAHPGTTAVCQDRVIRQLARGPLPRQAIQASIPGRGASPNIPTRFRPSPRQANTQVMKQMTSTVYESGMSSDPQYAQHSANISHQVAARVSHPHVTAVDVHASPPTTKQTPYVSQRTVVRTVQSSSSGTIQESNMSRKVVQIQDRSMPSGPHSLIVAHPHSTQDRNIPQNPFKVPKQPAFGRAAQLPVAKVTKKSKSNESVSGNLSYSQSKNSDISGASATKLSCQEAEQTASIQMDGSAEPASKQITCPKPKAGGAGKAPGAEKVKRGKGKRSAGKTKVKKPGKRRRKPLKETGKLMNLRRAVVKLADVCSNKDITLNKDTGTAKVKSVTRGRMQDHAKDTSKSSPSNQNSQEVIDNVLFYSSGAAQDHEDKLVEVGNAAAVDANFDENEENVAVSQKLVDSRSNLNIEHLIQGKDGSTKGKSESKSCETVDPSTQTDPFCCIDCSKTFKSEQTFALHSCTSGPKKKRFSCPECQKQFKIKAAFIKHIDRNHNATKIYMCSDCGKCFRAASTLIMHRKVHTGEQQLLSCEKCGKCFDTEALLKEHSNMHADDDEQFPCDECGEYFNKDSLQQHMEVHTGVTTVYTCNDCKKTFTKKQSLKNHMKNHRVKKPFSCPYCEKTFHYKSPFSLHMKSHTDAIEDLGPQTEDIAVTAKHPIVKNEMETAEPHDVRSDTGTTEPSPTNTLMETADSSHTNSQVETTEAEHGHIDSQMEVTLTVGVSSQPEDVKPQDEMSDADGAQSLAVTELTPELFHTSVHTETAKPSHMNHADDFTMFTESLKSPTNDPTEPMQIEDK